MLYLKVVKDVYCWTIAILFIALFSLGWYMVGLHFYDRWYHDSLMLHKSLGMVMLALVFIKVGWMVSVGIFRSYRRSYRHRTSQKSAGRRFPHFRFYLLMAAINLTGYLISTSAGTSVSVFRLFGIPASVSVGKRSLEVVIWGHYFLAYGSVLLILLHAFVQLWPRLKVRYS